MAHWLPDVLGFLFLLTGVAFALAGFLSILTVAVGAQVVLETGKQVR